MEPESPIEELKAFVVDDDAGFEEGGAFAEGGSPVTAGVAGPDPAIGGKDSNNAAPNDEVGLKGFKPCRRDCTGEIGEVDVN